MSNILSSANQVLIFWPGDGVDHTAAVVRQHDVDLVLALLSHEHVRLVLGVVNIADTVVEKINNLYKICTWCPSG